tara:strand:+ start:5954 stop:7558 length:1605 start_codon:yes stop_codon:yes gene_type:complete
MAYVPIAQPPVENYDTDDRVTAFIKKYKEAEQIHDHWKDKYEEAYEYTMPQRESFYEETIGERRTDKIFDETAVVGIQEFASRLQAGIVPTYGRWANLQAGTEIPDEAKPIINEQLDKITEYVFEVLANSNFNQEVHEAFMDCAIGTGVLLVEEGDSLSPINFTAVPLPRVMLNNGPDQKIDTVFRKRTMRYDKIMIAYPKAEMSEKMMKRIMDTPTEQANIVEGVFKVYDEPNVEKYKYCVVCMTDQELILEKELEGSGSNPYIVFRWNKASGEVYGRGPVFNAMAAIKTTNLVVELILQNAQMNISGIYTFEDDGVINPDTITLTPGSLIPVAPNSRGLQALPAAGRFDVAQLVLGDMRQNIKKALYMETLGRPEGTPMSATEVSQRMADLSTQIGSSFGRLQSELITPLLRRVIRILIKMGKIDIPKVNGREVKIVSTSPLSQAQHEQDVQDVLRFSSILAQTFGPQMLNLVAKQDEMAKYLAEKMGLPEKLIRDAGEQQELLSQLQNQQQQANMVQNELGIPQDQTGQES